MSRGTFKKYICLKFPNFDPPSPPLFTLVCFRAPHPPPSPQNTFVLASTHPLHFNICTCEIYRKEINNEH